MSEDKAKCGHSLYWFGCYRGTYDLISSSSMAHPAKMAPALCFRILQHLEELGLLKKGQDTVLDPMSGTGITNICAGAMGYPSISVELEEKFIDLQRTYLCPGIAHYTVEEILLPAVAEGWKTEATGGYDTNGGVEYKTYWTKVLPERKRYKVSATSRCGKKEWHSVHRVTGNKEYAERRLYKSLDWTLIKGDSRRLSELLKEQNLKSITSPPYGEAIGRDAKYYEKIDTANKKRALGMYGKQLPSYTANLKYSYVKSNAGDNPDNIGNLKDTPLKSITSPPYQDSQGHPSLGSVNKDDWGKEGKDIVKRRGLSGEYGDTEGQVGNLKSIVSPPYEESLPNGLDRKAAEQMVQAMYDKHGRTYSKEDFEYQVELILKRSNRDYGDAEGQIGKLKDKPLKSIVSPPYSEAQSGGGIAKKGYTGSKHTPTDLVGERSYMPEVHGQSEGQIANLKDIPLKSIVSPPYGDAEKRDRSKEASDEKEKDYPRGDRSISAGYQGSEDNIGKLADKPLKSVVSPPYGLGKGTGHADNKRDTRPILKDRNVNLAYNDESADNIGNLTDKPLKSVMSPPYDNARNTTQEYDDKYDLRRPPNVKWGRESFRGRYGDAEGQIGKEKQESYLEAMKRVYSEIALVSDVLCIVLKNPTRNGKIRRLDLDTLAILKDCGWNIHCQHRALLFEELEQADMFEGSKKQVKGRLSFFKRLSWQNGNPVSSWEDVISCVRK